jgi:polyhydroxybutyrate depolymerase
MLRLAAGVTCALLALAAPVRAQDLERRLTVEGRERGYLLHAPAFPAEDMLPLVVVLHGAGQDARVIRAQTGFSDEADLRGFAVAYPYGSRAQIPPAWTFGDRQYLVWNAGACCGYARDAEIDDVTFVRTVVEDAARELPIDRDRIYAAGLSNGGMLAQRLACEASDLFAAVGVVSGAMAVSRCAPTLPVSVVQMHGTADVIVPYAGGAGRTLTPPGWAYPSARSAATLWAGINACDPRPIVSRVGKEDRLDRYVACRGGTEVADYEIHDGKHTWFGGSQSWWKPARLSATRVLWDFFASHPREIMRRAD